MLSFEEGTRDEEGLGIRYQWDEGQGTRRSHPDAIGSRRIVIGIRDQVSVGQETRDEGRGMGDTGYWMLDVWEWARVEKP
jgi:hypothetical protein